jgi:hypothetical protein
MGESNSEHCHRRVSVDRVVEALTIDVDDLRERKRERAIPCSFLIGVEHLSTTHRPPPLIWSIFGQF